MSPAPISFLLAVALYGLAGPAYGAVVAGARRANPRIGVAFLTAGLIVHTAELTRLGLAGVHPASSSGEAVGLLVWLLVSSFLLAQRRLRLDAVGTLVGPIAAALLVAAALSPGFGTGSTAGLGVLGRVHILLAVLSAACFALAAVVAVFYLVEEHQLKVHRVGRAVRHGADLETLDGVIYRGALVGLPALTLALAAGLASPTMRQPRLPLEYLLPAMTWTAFAALLLGRHAAGWRGRRAAMLTIVGFATTAAVLGIYLARGGGG